LLHTFLIHSVIGYITPVQKMTELKKVAWNVSRLIGPRLLMLWVMPWVMLWAMR
jgi:hypothetical protein